MAPSGGCGRGVEVQYPILETHVTGCIMHARPPVDTSGTRLATIHRGVPQQYETVRRLMACDSLRHPSTERGATARAGP